MFDDDGTLTTSGFPVVTVNGICHILGGDTEQNNTQFQCKPSSLPTDICFCLSTRVEIFPQHGVKGIVIFWDALQNKTFLKFRYRLPTFSTQNSLLHA